jgi:hypothetical protein
MRRSVVVLLIIILVGRGAVSAETTATALYQITFTSNWSQTTHPHPSSSLPGSAHWSAFVGGTHNGSVSFWQAGTLASPGLEQVAEIGSSATFLSEISAEITNGNADQTFNLGALNSAGGSVSGEVTVDSNFPHVTIVSMIAPSPDWFVGVSGVSLWDGTDWVSPVTVDLYPYDAGTEEGTDYSLSNPATTPNENVANVSGQHVFSAQPMGTLTFTKMIPTAVSLTGVEMGMDSEMTLPLFYTSSSFILLSASIIVMRRNRQLKN